MKNRNYSWFEYDEKERESLVDQYSKHFPEEITSDFTGKDILNNTSYNIRIVSFDPNTGIAVGETNFGQSVVIDTKKEEKHLKKLGYTTIEIKEGQILDIIVYKDKSGNFNGSISAGYEKSLKKELHESLAKENFAFKVKVKSICNGGFMVDLSGIECFLPGSLAAANRIMNFADYVGKEINVMVEVYDQKRDIFVVSFKKYLKKIIETEVKNLSFSSKYEGVVTGTSNTGVFVEWNEIFTGIIPFEETTKESLEKLKSGDSLSFYVVDIKNPQRIIVSLTEPNGKLKNIQELKDSSEGFSDKGAESKKYKGEISKIKTFGIFVKLENGLTGLIEKERLANPINEYTIGKEINCYVLKVDITNLKVQLVEA